MNENTTGAVDSNLSTKFTKFTKIKYWKKKPVPLNQRKGIL